MPHPNRRRKCKKPPPKQGRERREYKAELRRALRAEKQELKRLRRTMWGREDPAMIRAMETVIETLEKTDLYKVHAMCLPTDVRSMFKWPKFSIVD